MEYIEHIDMINWDRGLVSSASEQWFNFY